MYNFNNRKQAEEHLRGLTLTVPEDVVRKVVVGLRSGCSKYSLYMSGTNRKTGAERISICSKGTVDKIKKLLDESKLDTYLVYLKQSLIADKPRTEQIEDSKELVGGVADKPGLHGRLDSEDAGKDIRLEEHLDQVATAAKSLASNVEKLFYHKSRGSTAFRGDIVKGFRSYWGSPEDSKVIEIEGYLARCVLAHYEDKYDKLPYDYWEDVTKENVSQELADNLSRMATSMSYEPCPICPICQGLAGLPHIGRNWIRYKGKKTGKWRYMPEDF